MLTLSLKYPRVNLQYILMSRKNQQACQIFNLREKHTHAHTNAHCVCEIQDEGDLYLMQMEVNNFYMCRKLKCVDKEARPMTVKYVLNFCR